MFISETNLFTVFITENDCTENSSHAICKYSRVDVSYFSSVFNTIYQYLFIYVNLDCYTIAGK